MALHEPAEHSRYRRDGPAIPVGSAANESIVRLLVVMLRYRVVILGCALALALLVSLRGLSGDRSYTAVTTFITQSRTNPSSISGLAAQLGVTVPNADGAQSPQFYVDFLKSRQVLRAVVETPFLTDSARPSSAQTLIQMSGGNRSDRAIAREAAIASLERSLTAAASLRTGLVTLRVTAESPILAREIADRILELVNEFNLERSRVQASTQRKFIEERLSDANDQVRVAENRLQEFLEENRATGSPRVSRDLDRLRRDLGMKQQLYTSLAQAYEQAKIDEVRDSPVITVVDPPETPVFPTSRKLISKGLFALFLGALFGVLIGFLREFFKPPAAQSTDNWTELSRLWNVTKSDARHPLAALSRHFSGRGTRRAHA